jgi:hypothetical protein
MGDYYRSWPVSAWPTQGGQMASAAIASDRAHRLVATGPGYRPRRPLVPIRPPFHAAKMRRIAPSLSPAADHRGSEAAFFLSVPHLASALGLLPAALHPRCHRGSRCHSHRLRAPVSTSCSAATLSEAAHRHAPTSSHIDTALFR